MSQPDFGYLSEIVENVSQTNILPISGNMVILNPRFYHKIEYVHGPKERISLGIKQLTENPIEKLKEKYSKNSLVTCEIIEITNDGLNVKLEDGNKGFISKLNYVKIFKSKNFC